MIRKIKRIINQCVLIWVKKYSETILPLIFKELSVNKTEFYSFHKRPKNFEYIQEKKQETILEFAIILQGPILYKENYTLNTIKLYLKTHVNSVIIISTWEDNDTKDFDNINDQRVFIVKNKYPKIKGINNLNLQIFSTVEGLKKAESLGLEYSLKTRTDQRFYENDIFNYFICLQKQYPLSEDVSCLKKRIIVSSFTTLKYRPYGLSDMFMFGLTVDLLTYWDLPFKNNEIQVTRKKITVLEHAKLQYGEVYITTKFLEKIAYPIAWTLSDTWCVYTKYFCIIDHEVTDLHWFKYEYYIEKRFDYYEDHTFKIAKHKDWLLHYYRINNIDKSTEIKILNSVFGHKI